MDQFKIDARVTLEHINTRKEGGEDDRTLAVDLKLTTRISADIANFFGEGLKDALFLADGTPRFIRMEQIGFDIELLSYLLILHEQHHYGVTVKKFKLKPVKNFFVDLTFSISFKPTSTVIATLAEFLDEKVDISLAPQNKELDFNEAEPKPIDSGVYGEDPLFADAKEWVKGSQNASISGLQRQLRIGYNRAARLIEALESAGYVTAMSGDGSRSVLQ